MEATDCGPGMFVQRDTTSSSDRVCDECPANQYQSTFNSFQCQPYSTCGAGTYELNMPTPVQDRICISCDGITGYQDEVNQPSCKEIIACDGSQYEAMSPSSTSNRVCKPVTLCSSGYFQVNPPTPTSDRTCEKWSSCENGFTQEIAPTPTSDRVCGILYVVGFRLDYATVEASRNEFLASFIGALVNVTISASNIYLRPGSVLADVYLKDFGSSDNLKAQVRMGLSFLFQRQRVTAQDVAQPSTSSTKGSVVHIGVFSSSSHRNLDRDHHYHRIGWRSRCDVASSNYLPTCAAIPV
jgi:hypothetical protein